MKKTLLIIFGLTIASVSGNSTPYFKPDCLDALLPAAALTTIGIDFGIEWYKNNTLSIKNYFQKLAENFTLPSSELGVMSSSQKILLCTAGGFLTLQAARM
ncbi:hypothetical protein KAU11_01445, partial [Candidatus Babeliales bacterium]|nr:hypothetical protein [Candidatus Babeliales bacterium]